MNLHFWQTPESWPSDSPEYVFLARAFNKIGSAVFGPKWTLLDDESAVEREQDSNEDDWDEDASDEDDWESNLEKMQAAVQREIASQCLAGILVTAVRRKAGGKMTKLEPSHWHTENYSARFYRCQMSLSNPFPRTGVIASGSHWIYVTRESLDRYLTGPLYAKFQLKALGKPKPTKAVKLTAGREKSCCGWLIEQMKANTSSSKGKNAYREEAKLKFSVGTRAFDRAWADAIKATERYDLSNPGAKRKS